MAAVARWRGILVAPVRRWGAVAVALAVIAVGAAACAEEEEWWAADIAEAPCELGMEPSIERETSQSILSARVILTGYETVCAFELTGDVRVRLDVFPAGARIADALAEGSPRTPGTTGQTDHQEIHRYPGVAPTIYGRGVIKDVGVHVSITLDAPDDELIAANEALVLDTARAVIARR